MKEVYILQGPLMRVLRRNVTKTGCPWFLFELLPENSGRLVVMAFGYEAKSLKYVPEGTQLQLRCTKSDDSGKRFKLLEILQMGNGKEYLNVRNAITEKFGSIKEYEKSLATKRRQKLQESFLQRYEAARLIRNREEEEFVDTKRRLELYGKLVEKGQPRPSELIEFYRSARRAYELAEKYRNAYNDLQKTVEKLMRGEIE